MPKVQKKFDRDQYRANAMEMVRRASEKPEAAQKLANAMTELAERSKRTERGLERASNQTEAVVADTGMKNVASGVLALPIFFGVKYFYGGDKKKAAEMIAHWEETGAEKVGAPLSQYPMPWDHFEGAHDPRTYFGFMPKALAHTGGWLLVAGVAALLGGEKNRANLGTRTSLTVAYLTLAEWLGSFAEGLGAERVMRRMLSPGGQQKAA